MALRINASNEYINVTSALPATTDFTACCWLYSIAWASWRVAIGVENTAYPTNSANYLFWSTDATQTRGLSTQHNGFSSFGTQPSLDTWYFIALVGDATNITALYAGVNDSSFQSVSQGNTTFTPGHIIFGNDTYDENWDGRFANCMVFDRALTTTELLNLKNQYVPVDYWKDLHSWIPCIESRVADIEQDYGPNNRSWNQGGTLSLEDGPPIVWAPKKQQLIAGASSPPVVSGAKLPMSLLGVGV